MMGHIDYSWWRPNPADLKAAGVTCVSRYLAFLPNGKVIDKPEYDALLAAGLGVMLNWESSGTSWHGGRATGLAEGAEARRQARALGHPDSRPIVQSMDQSVAASELNVASDYQHGFNDGGGCGPQGAYGTGLVLDHLFDAGLIVVGWQTNARGWEGNGPDCARSSLIQHTSHSYPALPSNQYDESTITKPDWGQVPAPSAPKPPPPPPPKVKPMYDPNHPLAARLQAPNGGWWDAYDNGLVDYLSPNPVPGGAGPLREMDSPADRVKCAGKHVAKLQPRGYTHGGKPMDGFVIVFTDGSTAVPEAQANT